LGGLSLTGFSPSFVHGNFAVSPGGADNMDERSSGALESLAGPLYVLALLLVVTPPVDVLANVWPPRLGEVSWRYGTVGASSGYLLTPLLGLGLACLIAIARRQRIMLRVLAVVCLVAGVMLVIAAIDFAMDAAQLRHTVPTTPALARWAFDVGAAKAIFKNLSAAVCFVWLGWATRRAQRALGAGGKHTPPPLVGHATERGQ